MNTPHSLSHFVWQDCLTPDIDLALGYFERLVSWKVHEQTWPNIGRYPIVQSESGAIAGILEMPKFLQESGVPPYWTGYVHTNLESAAEAIPELGGQMFTMPTRSAMGTSFVFTDVGGAVLAAYEISDSFSIPSSVNENEFVWRRLFSADNQKSADFYKRLFDWQTSSTSESSTAFFDQHKNPVGDMVSGASWVDTDTWVYFVGVEDVTARISVIEDHGGGVIQEARIQGRSAIVSRDPQGAVIGFVEWL